MPTCSRRHWTSSTERKGSPGPARVSEGPTSKAREGSLESPTRHAIDWKNPAFWDRDALDREVERVFDICHGCRRCFSLCNAFPVLFDQVDKTPTGDVTAVPKEARWEVVDNCYLCDMCYMSKCPYVPPHEWNVDFPHLMLRAKALRLQDGGASVRDRVLSSTTCGSMPGIRSCARSSTPRMQRRGRKLWTACSPSTRSLAAEVHATVTRAMHAATPDSAAVRRMHDRRVRCSDCYGNRNEPEIVADLVAIPSTTPYLLRLRRGALCGSRARLGDFDAIAKLKEAQHPALAARVAGVRTVWRPYRPASDVQRGCGYCYRTIRIRAVARASSIRSSNDALKGRALRRTSARVAGPCNSAMPTGACKHRLQDLRPLAL